MIDMSDLSSFCTEKHGPRQIFGSAEPKNLRFSGIKENLVQIKQRFFGSVEPKTFHWTKDSFLQQNEIIYASAEPKLNSLK